MAVLGTIYGAVNGMRRSIHPSPSAGPALKAPQPAERAPMLPVRARAAEPR